MLQVVRDADSAEEEQERRDSSTTTTIVDLSVPLTVLSCHPLLPLPSSAASSSSASPELVRLVPVHCPSLDSASHGAAATAASSALHSSSVSRLPYLILIQRTSTGHHYLFNYGSAPIRHNGRRLQQQRLAIAAHISRCQQWQTEQRTGQPHWERSEVQGTGGKPLEDGDQLELGGRLYVYWSHLLTANGSADGSSGALTAAAGGERTRKSTRRAVRQREPVVDEAKEQRVHRTALAKRVRREGVQGEEGKVAAETSDDSGGTRLMKTARARQSPHVSHPPADRHAAPTSVPVSSPSVREQRGPSKKRVRSRQGRLSEDAIARIAEFARQRQRGPNGVFLKVKADTARDQSEEDGEEDDEDEEMEEDEEHDDSGHKQTQPKVDAEAEQEQLGLSAARRLRRRHTLSPGATSVVGTDKRRRAARGSAALLDEEGNRKEEERSNREAEENRREAKRNGTATNNARRDTKRPKRRVKAAEHRPSSQDTAAVEEEKDEQEDRSGDSSGDGKVSEASNGQSRSKRVVRARRSLRGKMRQTRSSGPVTAAADNKEWPEADERKRARRGHQSAHKHKKQTQLRRMRRTPLSLLPNPPSTLLPLIPMLTCTVCNQLFVQPVSLPCSHSFCDYCLYSRLQLKYSACPACEQPVDEHDRKRGSYAIRSAPLESLAEAVAMQTLDVKGKRARARRQRIDTAHMKHVRAAWKRMQGAERSRERRRRERERVEEELSALLGRRRHSGANSSRSRVRVKSEEDDNVELVPRLARGSDSDDEDDDDFIPASDLESDDSAAHHQTDSESASATDSDDGGDSSSDNLRGSDDSESSSSSASTSASSSDEICSSEEDSVDMDRSLILSSSHSHSSTAVRPRPQRTRYELMYVPKRSRPPCRGCSLPLNQSELAIRVIHGSDIRWSHIACLRFSSAGRTIPLQRIDGMKQLTATEQQAVRDAWHREADDGLDSDNGGVDGNPDELEEEAAMVDEDEQHSDISDGLI